MHRASTGSLVAVAAGAVLLFAAGTASAADDTIKIAYIDPLSGAFANVGEQGVHHFQFAIDRVNARGGVLGGKKLELVTLDSKANPQDA